MDRNAQSVLHQRRRSIERRAGSTQAVEFFNVLTSPELLDTTEALLTNNNRVDIAGEGLDYAIRFGDGAWHGTKAELLLAGPLSPLCASALASRLRRPEDLAGQVLLRSYRTDEWEAWFEQAGLRCPVIRGVVFDSSLTLAEAATQGAGVALLPASMFGRELQQGRLVRPFELEIERGAYWLARLSSKQPTPAMQVFRDWLVRTAAP